MSVDFVVLGLPRSGTTWLANWLTTDRSLCLHDPFSRSLPELWDAGGKRLGISCTGAYLMPGWLESLACPVAVIERDPAACDLSLREMGLPSTWPLRRAFKSARGKRWRFEDIWQEEKARELWAFLLPGLAFDAPRYRLLCEMQIQPHIGKWKPDPSVEAELKRRGFFSVTED